MFRSSLAPHGLARALSALVLACAAWTGALAQGAPYVPAMPEDPAEVDVYLVTVGRGSAVYALFGHTILRVVDKKRGTDDNYNWGIFDFRDPLFAWTFYKGDLDYQLAILDYHAMVEHYRIVERRGMVQNKLNLTPAQKRVLLERLVENARPENLSYKYFQFRDNCATRPRDHLDAALGGALKARLTAEPSPLTFRTHIRRNAAPSWWVHLGLDQVSNSMLDRVITPWDEMFLPGELRRHLLEMPAFDDRGRPIPGQALLGATQTLLDLPEPSPQANPYLVFMLVLGGPIALAAVGSLAWPSRGLITPPPAERLAYRLLGLATLAYGLWSAFWGTLLLFNWIASQYDEVQHNAALLLFFPVDWLFVAYGLSLAVTGQLRGGLLGRATLVLAAAHLVGFAVLLAGWAAGGTAQDVLAPLATTGVLGLVLHTTLIRLAPSKGG